MFKYCVCKNTKILSNHSLPIAIHPSSVGWMRRVGRGYGFSRLLILSLRNSSFTLAEILRGKNIWSLWILAPMGLHFVWLILRLDETAYTVYKFFRFWPHSNLVLVVCMNTNFHACVTKTYFLMNQCRYRYTFLLQIKFISLIPFLKYTKRSKRCFGEESAIP